MKKMFIVVIRNIDNKRTMETREGMVPYNKIAFDRCKAIMTEDKTVIACTYNEDKKTAQDMAIKIARSKLGLGNDKPKQWAVIWQAKGKGPKYQLTLPNKEEAEQARQELCSGGHTATIKEVTE
jgi:hypothetical protein